jgi:hypothetical protein
MGLVSILAVRIIASSLNAASGQARTAMSDSEAALAQEIARLCRRYLERHARLIDLGDAGDFERDDTGQVSFVAPAGHGERARFPIETAPPATWTWRAALVGTPDSTTLLMLVFAGDPAGAQLALDAQIIRYVIEEIGADALRKLLHRSRTSAGRASERTEPWRTHAVSPRRRAGR